MNNKIWFRAFCLFFNMMPVIFGINAHATFSGTTNHENMLEIVLHKAIIYPNPKKEVGRFLFGGKNPEYQTDLGRF